MFVRSNKHSAMRSVLILLWLVISACGGNTPSVSSTVPTAAPTQATDNAQSTVTEDVSSPKRAAGGTFGCCFGRLP